MSILFALVDCNNFYVSCERVFNPYLINKPVVVLSNNDGCIIARSNEAKALNIPEIPFTLGMESSGVIIEIGTDIKDFDIGDEVIISAFTGSFSEELVVPEIKVRKKPLGLNWEQASTYTVAYLTAYVSLITKGDLKPGETLLVHGAAGGDISHYE